MQLSKIVDSVGAQLRTLDIWNCDFRTFDEYKEFLHQITEYRQTLQNLRIRFGATWLAADYLSNFNDSNYNHYEFLAKLQKLKNFAVELQFGGSQNEQQMIYLSESLAQLKEIEQIRFEFWSCWNLTHEAIHRLVTNIGNNLGSKVLSRFVIKYLMYETPVEANFDQIMAPVKLLKTQTIQQDLDIDNQLSYESLRSEFNKIIENPGIADRLMNLSLTFRFNIAPLGSKDFKMSAFLSTLKRLERFYFFYRYPGDKLHADIIKGLSSLRNLREVYLTNTHRDSTQTRNANAQQWIKVIDQNKGLHTLNCRNSVLDFTSRIEILQNYPEIFEAAKLQVDS